MTGAWHDFSVAEHDGGRLEAIGPPPVGARSAFSLELLAGMGRQGSVDADGRLHFIGMVFEPRRLDPGGIQDGPPRLLVCERVA